MPWELPITIEDTTYPVRFNTEAEPSQADIDEAVAYITQQRSAPAQKPGPPDSGQGRASSFASSVGRGAASIVPGVIGGAGYLTGSEGLVEAADTIEAGINRALPVNPAYEDEFLMKAGQALGQVVPMIGTGGAAGAVGKSMALARGLEAGAAAAKGTQLAGRVMLGSGMLQGTRGGGQAAEQYGMEGGAAYARALLGGAIEGATEKYLFGMGSELSPIGRMLGSGATPGATILRAAGTEGVEEGVAEIGGNLATTALAPSGTQTPGLFANAGEATALGAIAGGALGGFNAALGGGEKPTVEGVAVVQPPAPIQEEERLAPEVESAVERAIATIQPPTAVSPVATLEQQANETMDAFLGRLNAQQEQLAKDLKAFAVETVKVNADVLPATAAALQSVAPATVEAAPTVDPVQTARDRLKQAAAAPPTTPTLETPVVAPEVLPEEPVVDDLSQAPPPSEQPQPEPPIVEETAPPIEPIPVVKEDVASQEPAQEELETDRLIDVPQAMQFLYGKGLTKTDREKVQKLIEKNEREARKTGKIQGARSFYESEIEAAVEEILTQKQTSSDFRRTLEQARTNKNASQELSDLVNALDVAEATLKEIESDRGMFGVQWAEKNVRRRATTQKAKIRDLKQRIVALAPPIKKAPTPPITEDQFQKTENVVAPAGDTEVGLGMEELNIPDESEYATYRQDPNNVGAQAAYGLIVKGKVIDWFTSEFEARAATLKYNRELEERTGEAAKTADAKRRAYQELNPPPQAQPVAEKPAVGTPEKAEVTSPSALSRGKPRESIVFKTPVKTPLGDVVGYSWSSQLVEDVDSMGEPVLRRISNWEEATNNAETGRDIVHKFLIKKPDGTTSEVSLESTFGKMTDSDKKTIKAVVSAAKRLPFMRAELAELQDLQKQAEADYQRTQKLTPDPTKLELREPDVKWRAEKGDKVAYLDGVFLGFVESSDLNAKGELANKARFIYDNAWKWRGAQRKVEMTEAQKDRAKSLTRSVKKAEELLKSENVEVAKVATDTQPTSLAEAGPPAAEMKTPSATAGQPAPISNEKPTDSKRGQRGGMAVGVPPSDTGATDTAKRPSLGSTGKQIIDTWRSLQGVQVAPGETVVGWDVNGGGTYAFINDKLIKLKRDNKGFESTYTDATDADWQAVSDALDRGALQVEVRKITGLGNYPKVDAGKTVKVLHQATGKPLQEFLDTPEGAAWQKRMDEAVAARGPKVTTKLVTEEKAAELKKSIKRKIGGQTNMLLDPTLFADAVVLGTYYVEKGARTFAAFSEKMIDDIGESIRENLEDIYNAIKAQPGFDTTGMDGVAAAEAEPPAPEPATAPPPPVQSPPPAQAAPAGQPAPLEGPVSIVNAQLNQVAEIIGLPQIETPLDGPYKWEAAWEDARVEMEQNPNRGSELVSEMIARPREVSPVEVPILLREAVIRTNAYNAAVEAQTKATAGGQEAANQRVSDAINALADVQQASALMGTISGRALNFRKMSAWMDFSLANMVLRLKGAKQADLSKAEMKDAQDTSKKIADTEKKIEDTRVSAGAEAELTSIFASTLEQARGEAKKFVADLKTQNRAAAKTGKTTTGKTMKEYLQEKRAEANKRIRMRGGSLNAGLNPADLFDYATVMATYIAEGIVSLADLTAKMIGDYGPGIEKHIPQIKRDADAMAAEALEQETEGTTKSYAEQLVEPQGEALSDRWVYNRVKEWLVEQGEAGLKRDSKELLDEVFKVITKEVNAFDKSITEQQLRDMFSGYGKVKFPNPEAAAVKLRQMRRLELLFDKLERARAGVAPLRAGLQRDETTPEEREALRLLNQTMKDLDIPQAPSGRNIKTPLDAVKSRLKNSIEDLNKQIKDRKRNESPRKDVEYDDEAKALEADRDALQKQLDEIDPVKEPTVEERVKARLKDLDKQITDLQERLGKKDFAPSQNKTPITQEIQVKVDARDALSRTLKELRAETEIVPSLSQDQINELAQLSLGRQIKALEQQIKDQDVAPKTTPKAEATPMLYRLQARLEALRKERDDLKKSLGFGKKPKTDDELIDAAVASLEKTIDKLNKQISENDLTSKTRPSKTPEVAKIKNLRAERDSLREEVQRLRKAKEDAAKDPIAEKLKKDRKQLQRMIQGYEDKIKKGDFRKRPKIAKVYDDSLMQLEIDLDNIKAEWSKKVFEAHLASRPPLKRMLDTGGQVLNTSRAILTSMDLSAVLRQGGFIGLGNPIRAARNITPMLRAFTSDDVAKASLKRLKQRSNWRNYTLAGLYIAETDQTKMSAQEEAFMSRWVDKIPGGYKGLFIGSLVRGSQRAYLTFLNNLRADTFDSLLNQLQKGPTPTREEMESIARYINVATGRGDLGKGAFNQAAVGLNTIFFAPRLVASRFQIIGGMPIFKATGRTKALVLQEYAKFIMGAAIVYALAGMAQDDDDEPLEFDPRSSDFLKVRFGNTRVDPLGGLIQATVFTSRVLSGETKSAKGKITPIRDTLRPANLFRDVPRTDKVPYGGRNVFNVGADFMRTKFSPAFGGFVDLTVGENVIGEAVTPLDIAYKMTVPMSFDEARETIEAHGMPKGPALTALMLFGAGVMTYDERKK